MNDAATAATTTDLWAAQFHGEDTVTLETDIADRHLLTGVTLAS